MIDYVYDGSIDGLMCVIKNSLDTNTDIHSITPEGKNYQPSVFSDTVKIDTNMTVSRAFKKELFLLIGREAMENIKLCFLSKNKQAEMCIYKFIKKGYIYKKALIDHLEDEDVDEILKTVRRVNRERHLMLGFLRFELTSDGIYYAKYSPDNNITALIVPHFMDRMPDQKMIIHDEGRCLAAIINPPEFIMAENIELHTPDLAEEEFFMKESFKKYFKTMALEDRTRKKVQAQLMPRRYWKYIFETNEK